MSNSKLTPGQKIERKHMLQNLKGKRFGMASNGRNTVCVLRTGPTSGVFAVSVMGVTEQKFRRKVGEYHALERLHSGESSALALETTAPFETAEEKSAYLEARAAEIADVLG